MKTYFVNKLSKKLVFISSACALLVFASCKKYLDQQPITSYGTEFVFSSVSNAYQSLASVYSRLSGDQGYGIRLSLYYTVDNDETQGPTGSADNDRRDIARYAAVASNAQLNSPFVQLFQGIEYANICIDQIPKMALYTSGTDNQKKQLQRMYGEALTLRAQFYFEAIRNWGDLPADFEPAYTLASTNPFPSRTNRDTLYNHLLDDLKTAETLVPWLNEITAIGDQLDERLTKGAVKGLRARIALFRGGYSLRQDGTIQRTSDYLTYYQIARDECNEIINSAQHSLNASYKDLWKNQVCGHVVNDPNGELMFQVSGIGLTGSEDTKLAYYNGPTMATTVGTSTTTYGNKSINILPTYFYLFDSTDTRRDVTCCPYNLTSADGVNTVKTGQAITAMNDGKYRRDWISNPVVLPTSAAQYFSLKWQILRYSDVLLMFAEAENELNGPTTAAYAAINQVRRRGYGKDVSTTNTTVDLATGLAKSAFFTAIVKERSLELGGEGVRKFDLIRWNLLASKISEAKAALLLMSTAAAPYNTLPASMYFKTNSTADDVTAWSNSFYKTAPTSTPSGTTKLAWIGSAINTVALVRYATGFVTGKSELLPIPQAARDANSNLSQNPNY